MWVMWIFYGKREVEGVVSAPTLRELWEEVKAFLDQRGGLVVGLHKGEIDRVERCAK